MPKYLIEREIPGAGAMSKEDLQGASAKSCSVINAMPDGISWLNSFVTDDKIYCVYEATDESMIREHAEKSGFPANRISEVRNEIDPSWSN